MDKTINQYKPSISSPRGFTLLEGMIALVLLATAGSFLFGAFSFSVRTQQELRVQLEASRSAGEILEILRATSFDSLVDVENGDLTMDPLGRFQQMILADIQDRLDRQGLQVYFTIRPYLGRPEMKFMTITIASADTDPFVSLENVAPGQTLVKMSTLVTKKGINP